MSKKDFNSQLIDRIDTIIQEYMDSLATNAQNPDISAYHYFLARFESIIGSIPQKNNSYQISLNQAKNFVYLQGHNGHSISVNNKYRLDATLSILKALREDISKGYLTSISEILNADLFSDFLEMAEHLLEEGYKDPAAVIIGSVLEEHIRKLCAKNSLSIDATDSKGVTRPKKADQLNSELTAAGIYSKLDQKSVTAWLDLRNKAAHGQYTDYSKAQVELLLQSVRDFITRHPA